MYKGAVMAEYMYMHEHSELSEHRSRRRFAQGSSSSCASPAAPRTNTSSRSTTVSPSTPMEYPPSAPRRGGTSYADLRLEPQTVPQVLLRTRPPPPSSLPTQNQISFSNGRSIETQESKVTAAHNDLPLIKL